MNHLFPVLLWLTLSSPAIASVDPCSNAKDISFQSLKECDFLAWYGEDATSIVDARQRALRTIPIMAAVAREMGYSASGDAGSWPMCVGGECVYYGHFAYRPQDTDADERFMERMNSELAAQGLRAVHKTRKVVRVGADFQVGIRNLRPKVSVLRGGMQLDGPESFRTLDSYKAFVDAFDREASQAKWVEMLTTGVPQGMNLDSLAWAEVQQAMGQNVTVELRYDLLAPWGGERRFRYEGVVMDSDSLGAVAPLRTREKEYLSDRYPYSVLGLLGRYKGPGCSLDLEENQLNPPHPRIYAYLRGRHLGWGTGFASPDEFFESLAKKKRRAYLGSPGEGIVLKLSRDRKVVAAGFWASWGPSWLCRLKRKVD